MRIESESTFREVIEDLLALDVRIRSSCGEVHQLMNLVSVYEHIEALKRFQSLLEVEDAFEC